MQRTITQRELRNNPGAVLRDVQAGQTTIVTRNGIPVAEMRPVSAPKFVPRAVIAATARHAPPIDYGRLRAELDAAVDHLIGEDS